jgi:hypothetical protein
MVLQICIREVKVKLSLCLNKHHVMKTYWGVEEELHAFLTSALDADESRDSSVGIELGYGLDDRGSRVRFPAGAGNFSLPPPRPERLWGPPSLLSNGY